MKAHRKPLLWPWPWGACSGSGLGPGVPAGDGVWRVWKVLEGLEGLEGFGRFGAFAGGQTAALKVIESHCCGLGPGVPVGEVALALRCLLGKVFLEGVWRVWRVLEGLEGLEGFGGFGAFAGWQTAALKAHRKPLLWPWPWGACSGSGLGPGVPAGDGVWRVWRVWKVLECLELALGCLLGKVFGILEGFGAFAGWQTAALKAHRKSLLWPWPWGACWGSCLRVKVWRVWKGLMV